MIDGTQIKPPISVKDLSTILGKASNDVGTLCLSPSINMWSKMKPINCNSVANNNGGWGDEVNTDGYKYLYDRLGIIRHHLTIPNRAWNLQTNKEEALKLDGTPMYIELTKANRLSDPEFTGSESSRKDENDMSHFKYGSWRAKGLTVNRYRMTDFNGYQHAQPNTSLDSTIPLQPYALIEWDASAGLFNGEVGIMRMNGGITGLLTAADLLGVNKAPNSALPAAGDMYYGLAFAQSRGINGKLSHELPTNTSPDDNLMTKMIFVMHPMNYVENEVSMSFKIPQVCSGNKMTGQLLEWYPFLAVRKADGSFLLTNICYISTVGQNGPIPLVGSLRMMPSGTGNVTTPATITTMTISCGLSRNSAGKWQVRLNWLQVVSGNAGSIVVSAVVLYYGDSNGSPLNTITVYGQGTFSSINGTFTANQTKRQTMPNGGAYYAHGGSEVSGGGVWADVAVVLGKETKYYRAKIGSSDSSINMTLNR